MYTNICIHVREYIIMIYILHAKTIAKIVSLLSVPQKDKFLPRIPRLNSVVIVANIFHFATKF